MTASEFFGKFKSKYLWGNLAAMAIVIVVLLLGTKIGIGVYTHHGEAIVIPNIVHKKYANAAHVLEQLGLRIEVNDTGYVKTLPPDCILEQNSEPGERVKAGHVIYVTINASHTPTLTLPDIIDNSSLREAMAKLTAMGFKLTTPQFVPGEKDWVYGVVVGGRHMVYGDKIPVDAAVTIQAGNGQRDINDSVNYVGIEPDDNFDEEVESEDDPFEEVKEQPAQPSEPTDPIHSDPGQRGE